MIRIAIALLLLTAPAYADSDTTCRTTSDGHRECVTKDRKTREICTTTCRINSAGHTECSTRCR
jgi:hypothetical protein